MAWIVRSNRSHSPGPIGCFHLIDRLEMPHGGDHQEAGQRDQGILVHAEILAALHKPARDRHVARGDRAAHTVANPLLAEEVCGDHSVLTQINHKPISVELHR